MLDKEFQLFLTSGCFDIAARKEFVMLIKALTNVDGFVQEQAQSLKTISYFVSAYPLVVSERTNRGFLYDEVIYSRFQVPVVTPQMFECMIEEEIIPEVKAIKGKHTVTINTTYLRKKREELNLSLEELSKEIRISKKALYEIENQRVNPTQETVKRLEELLGIDLKVPYRMERVERTYVEPKDEFQKKVSLEFSRLGIDNSAVTSASFEIIGKEKTSLVTGLSTNTVKIKKVVSQVKGLSSIFSSQGIFVAKKSHEQAIDGVPIVLESELPELKNSRELNKLIREKSE
ncbi:MAG: helix-turn-helix domain-containing protein [Candidatus Aenigmarchaeota archaeon]|nr:helix-turn-helix domain-containing protein [Candidatus Aenigmarchaeota archaeon]